MKTTHKFRLYKRKDDGREMASTEAGYKDRPYYFRFTHRGRAYPRCLETPDATEAQRRAKAKYAEIVAAVSSGEYKRLDATKLRQSHNTTLEQLFAAYRAGPAEANATTRQVNINAFKQLAGTAASVRELTPAVARQWFTAAKLVVLNCPDQEAAASLKRSANSRWAQAKSIFTDGCLSHYQDLGLINGPSALDDFVRAGNNERFKRIPKQNYNPPSEAIITKTLAAWETISARDLFLAIGHELAFGLRKGEMEQARWSWHTERNGYPVLDGHADVKNGSGLVQVRALDPFYSTMKCIAQSKDWWKKPSNPDELIIQGTETYRTDDLYRRVSDWLRALGWQTMKTNHALRAYAGSQVAMKYGIYEAQMWLRHSTVKVTEQNYSHFVNKFKPADINTLAARWAVIPAKVSSAAADATLDATSDFRHTPINSPTVEAWTHKFRN